MPSVKRDRRSRRSLAVLVLCGAIGAGSLGGCSTTQEKAAAHQEEATRILEAREKKGQQKKHGKEKR